MEIIKSKRKGCICRSCRKPIENKYKVCVTEGWEHTTYLYYHLSCYFRRLKRQLEGVKEELKKFSKTKFKKQMIVENI